MTLEEALFAHVSLTSGATFTGAIVGTRIYPQLIPQGCGCGRPSRFSASAVASDNLAHDGPIGFGRATIQITCQGKEYRDAKPIAQAVRKDLNGYKGVMGGSRRRAPSGDAPLKTRLTATRSLMRTQYAWTSPFIYEEQ